jgi:hypothetical protein
MYQLRTESNAAWWWRKHGMNEWIGGIVVGVLLAVALVHAI